MYVTADFTETVPQSERIAVQEGDCIGWYTIHMSHIFSRLLDY